MRTLTTSQDDAPSTHEANLPDPTALTRVIDAIDKAVMLILDQLADDLNLRARKVLPTSLRHMSAEDLREVARICVEESQSTPDRGRKKFLAKRAFAIALVAEGIARDGGHKGKCPAGL